MASRTARKFRKSPTDAELRLWTALKQNDLPYTHFRRQVSIGPYIADFACHAAKLIIEVDGRQHNLAANQIADAERTAFLESRGYKVLRFWNPEVLGNLSGVVEMILVEIVDRMKPPPGSPCDPTSPQGGG